MRELIWTSPPSGAPTFSFLEEPLLLRSFWPEWIYKSCPEVKTEFRQEENSAKRFDYSQEGGDGAPPAKSDSTRNQRLSLKISSFSRVSPEFSPSDLKESFQTGIPTSCFLDLGPP